LASQATDSRIVSGWEGTQVSLIDFGRRVHINTLARKKKEFIDSELTTLLGLTVLEL
jgi:hypothetical protein